MPRNQTYAAHLFWKHSSWRHWRQFLRACRDPQQAQEHALKRLLRSNAGSEFGRQHHFSTIRSAADYRQRVALSDYEDYRVIIERMRRGGTNLLTSEEVLLLEPTSGTSGGSKLIPLTAGLRSNFQSAVGAWICNLLRSYPKLMRGRSYWLVSPSTPLPAQPGDRIPTGFADDAEYLSAPERRLLRHIIITPAELARVQPAENLYYMTLLYLLHAADLRLISIWNPTVLEILLNRAAGWLDSLLADIHNGSISLPQPAGVLPLPAPPADPRRAAQVQTAAAAGTNRPGCWQAIWPELQLISCWCHGWAAAHVQPLQRLFPEVIFQPKGLLATEGVVTIPVHDRQGAFVGHALTPHLHYYEFEDCASGEICDAALLIPGRSYKVILSTAGGLYRYRLHDIVQVGGFFHRSPLLTFLGKDSPVSDLFGEKLHETHVQRVIESCFGQLGIHSSFYFLAPDTQKKAARYRLFYTTTDRADNTYLSTILEAGLRENYHYAHCRELGQLEHATAVACPPDLPQRYLEKKARNGKSGTVKFRLLEGPGEWEPEEEYRLPKHPNQTNL